MSLCLINAIQPPIPYPLLKKYKAPPILFKSTLKILGTCGTTTRKVETCWLPPSWMIFCRWSAMRLRNALLKGKPSRCGNTSAVSTTVSWTSYKENYSTNSKHFNKINQSPQTKKMRIYSQFSSIFYRIVYLPSHAQPNERCMFKCSDKNIRMTFMATLSSFLLTNSLNKRDTRYYEF